MTIRICIADDNPLMLAGIRQTLESAEGITVVGSTSRGEDVLSLVTEISPDLVLLDHQMPGADGVACIGEIVRSRPGVKVVLLSSSEEAGRIAEGLSAGAAAYIGKRINPNDLASALRQIVAGVVYQAAPVVAQDRPVAVTPAPCDLTDRELTMLDAIARGLSTKMISRELWISEKTVKFHLTNIYRKLGVQNRAGAMRYAYENGLVGASQARASATLSVAAGA